MRTAAGLAAGSGLNDSTAAAAVTRQRLECRSKYRHDKPIMPSPAHLPKPQPLAITPEQRVWNQFLFYGLLLWTFLCLCYPLYDTDFWWHLKTGEWILENGTVPQVDLYTFTEEKADWIDLHWGFQVLITLLYRLGNVNLVILVKATVVTAAVAIGWSAGGRNLTPWLKTALWIPPVVCISGRSDIRPEILTLLFLSLWLWIATRVESRPRLIWLLPVLLLVWVNCHALFVLGLVVGASYVIDCLVREFAQGRWGLEPPAREPSAKAIIRAGGLVVLACLANPYFQDGALFPLTLYRKFTVDQDFYSVNIGEFRRPLDFVMLYGWRGMRSIYLLAEIAVWCSAATSFVWLLVRRRQWSVMRLVLFIGFSNLAWEATRNTSIFSLVAGWIACENFHAAAIPGTPVDERIQRRWNWYLASALTSTLTILIFTVVSGVWNDIGDRNKPFGLGEAAHWFIHEPSKFAGQPGFPGRAFVANNGQAEVFIYHNAPAQKVFMDARLEVCTRNTFQAYNEILALMARGDPNWQAMFNPQNDDDLPVVILDSRYSLLQIRGMLLIQGWRPVFADRTAAVFLSDARARKLSLPKIELPSQMKRDLDEIESRLMLIRSSLTSDKSKLDKPPDQRIENVPK